MKSLQEQIRNRRLRTWTRADNDEGNMSVGEMEALWGMLQDSLPMHKWSWNELVNGLWQKKMVLATVRLLVVAFVLYPPTIGEFPR